MNDMTVGMENLPNVFINKILILPKGSGVEVKVQLAMYDHKTNRSWKNKINDLKTKIVFESRADRISMLNAGTMSLYDYEPSPQGYSTTEPFDCYVIGVDSFSPVSVDGEYELNVELFTYTKPLRENLNVYAACFIDGFGFGIPMFDKFYGPMAAERIFVGGELNTLSNYFYYPDTNEEYGGPVHQKPNGSFMEGSQHSDDAHKDVRLVTEENYKIQFHTYDISDPMVGGLSAFITGRYSRYTPDENGPTDSVSNDGLVVDTSSLTGPQNPGGPQSGFSPNAPTPTIEDPNIPDSTPDRIY